MGETTTSARIPGTLNDRLKKVLAKSSLSKDQFIAFALAQVLDQVEAEQLDYEPLEIVRLVRRELNKPVGESLLSRLQSMAAMLGSGVGELPTLKRGRG